MEGMVINNITDDLGFPLYFSLFPTTNDDFISTLECCLTIIIEKGRLLDKELVYDIKKVYQHKYLNGMRMILAPKYLNSNEAIEKEKRRHMKSLPAKYCI
ncbi:hypothetical protein CDIK_3687 [Cucumispora dikerogammari]|nr:hypothetical protein CDIK_3687 [Cucumispora dikerogammari]